METKTILVVVAGVVILALLFILVIYTFYRESFPVITLVVDRLMNLIENLPLLTGDLGDWPSWAG